MLKQLVHNGIIVPAAPEPLGLKLRVRGVLLRLAPEQEEMALAWARKRDTPYVHDAVFAANFMHDFSLALGVQPDLRVDEVDWSPCDAVVDEERARKEAASPDERKAAAADRKAERDALKARYGYAIVNGQRVELGNYMSEPSGIFMGRGEHPLRGRWKAGARQSDVTLNLSPDAPRPQGAWADIVWQPESLWVARWHDQLADKLKYIWLADTAPVKQNREEKKFDKAVKLAERIDEVSARIEQDLASDDERVRMVATACYLIDKLCLRVGDEKDPDEADTVGATTLRPEHVTLSADGVVEFNFLGKDSVAWHKSLRPPAQVLRNLAELIAHAHPSRQAASQPGATAPVSPGKPQIFPDVGSDDVNTYLSQILPGLSAKVFRTHHATRAVRTSLGASGVRREDAAFRKWHASAQANLEAALLCNHTKQDKSDWVAVQERYRQRADKAQERLTRMFANVHDAQARLEALKEEAVAREAGAASDEQRQRLHERYVQRLAKAREDVAKARAMRARAEEAVQKISAQEDIAGKKRTWNLGTSLKSYIDPRVYHEWGNRMAYDVLASYYPTMLQRKFAWVKAGDAPTDPEVDDLLRRLALRPCMTSDVAAVLSLYKEVAATRPALDLPLDAGEFVRRCLPALEQPWRQGLLALDEQEHAVGFAAVGPPWERDGATLLDLFAVVAPGWDTPALAAVLAEQVWQAVQAFEMQHPGVEAILEPRDSRWCAVAAALCRVLLADDQSDETD